MMSISSSYSNPIQFRPTCSVPPNGITRSVPFSSGFARSSGMWRNFLSACCGVRNGYDLFGRKLSSKTKESPGRRLGLMFFHESKKFRNPDFLSHCGAVPLLLWKRLLRIGYIGYNIIKGLVVFWFLLLLSLYEFYNSVDEIFVKIRNCLSKARSEFFEFSKMNRKQNYKTNTLKRRTFGTFSHKSTEIVSGMTETRDYLSITIGMTTGVRPVRR
jgi:hypothetical protein